MVIDQSKIIKWFATAIVNTILAITFEVKFLAMLQQEPECLRLVVLILFSE